MADNRKKLAIQLEQLNKLKELQKLKSLVEFNKGLTAQDQKKIINKTVEVYTIPSFDFKNTIHLKKNNDIINYENIFTDINIDCDVNPLLLKNNKLDNTLEYNITINKDKPSIHDNSIIYNDFKYYYLFIITHIRQIQFRLILSMVLYLHQDTLYDIEKYIQILKKLYDYLKIADNILNDKSCRDYVNVIQNESDIVNLVNDFEKNI